ncbi:hypothetical protein CKAH01_18179 [Colletotrichum kahawae]|uniref:Uncharacterized protein n=1 Tax=Colletotrichum kahawae TaxID=34407 RepID=A0AAD9YAQ6_COLKA|nr:hypothetical protein CKAH01_18179 [Colletotrichum kahawae]
MKAPGTGTPCIEVPASSNFFRFQELTEAGWFFSIIFGRLKRYLCRPQATGPSFPPIPNLLLSYRQPGSNNFPPAIPQQLTIAVPAVFNTRSKNKDKADPVASTAAVDDAPLSPSSQASDSTMRSLMAMDQATEKLVNLALMVAKASIDSNFLQDTEPAFASALEVFSSAARTVAILAGDRKPN